MKSQSKTNLITGIMAIVAGVIVFLISGCFGPTAKTSVNYVLEDASFYNFLDGIGKFNQITEWIIFSISLVLIVLGILALLRYKDVIKSNKFAKIINILMMTCFIILTLICFTGFILMTAGQIHYGSHWRFNLYGYLVSTLIVAGCLATQIILLVKENKKVTRIVK